MEQFFDFVINNYLLVGAFAILLALLAVTELRRGGQTINSQGVTRLLNTENAVLIDLRDSKDYARGHITSAINIPHAKLAARMGELDKYKSTPVILVDAIGQHSGAVGKELKAAGFENVVRLSGGIGTWQGDSLPLVKN